VPPFALATIATDDGPRAALVVEDRVIEVAATSGLRQDETVLGILADHDEAAPRLAQIAAEGGGIAREAAAFLAPIPLPPAIYCAGANYADHAAEMARVRGREPPKDPRERGQRSWHFIKSSRTVVGPGARVAYPAHVSKLDFEAELAVVIGRPARNVAAADSLDHVAGYTIANDLSARDHSRRADMPEHSSFRSDWLAQKSFDGACPMGPWITLARDIADPHALAISLTVNGAPKQDSSTGQMIFSIGDQIEDLSARLTLHPGDIILTGTPAGVGNGRGEFLAPGDTVAVRIAGLGELVTTIT